MLTSLESRIHRLRNVMEDPPEWQVKKNIAVQKAAESIISSFPEKSSEPHAFSESDDSDAASDTEYSREYILKFAKALKSNFILDLSFHDSCKSNYCFCPCSSNLIKWRKDFGVTTLSDCDSC